AIIFTASRDLEAGEELCHRYFDVEGDWASRQEHSKCWGFACGCKRCHFEAQRLPGTSAALAVDAATSAFRERLRFEMRALAAVAKAPAAHSEEDIAAVSSK
ncbi:unnamed protein product, partial [Polarella glacialis]